MQYTTPPCSLSRSLSIRYLFEAAEYLLDSAAMGWRPSFKAETIRFRSSSVSCHTVSWFAVYSGINITVQIFVTMQRVMMIFSANSGHGRIVSIVGTSYSLLHCLHGPCRLSPSAFKCLFSSQ